MSAKVHDTMFPGGGSSRGLHVPSGPIDVSTSLPFAIAVPVGEHEAARRRGVVTARARIIHSIAPTPQVQAFGCAQYLHGEPLTLTLTKCRRRGMSVQDESSGVTLFQSEPNRRLLHTSKKIEVRDNDGKCAFVMKEQNSGAGANAQCIYEPGKTGGHHLLRINSETTFAKVKMHGKVTNKVTGQKLLIVLKSDGRWCQDATVYIGEPKEGGIAIASIGGQMAGTAGGVDNVFNRTSKYTMTINPGIDMGLIVAFCIAFDLSARSKTILEL